MFPVMTADEAAQLIRHDMMVGVSGFTPAGSPKAIPRALAKRAKYIHEKGEKFQVRLISGASTGRCCDDELALERVISWRAPYMTSSCLREQANSEELDFIDMHLSHVSQMILQGFLGEIDVAIVEATAIEPRGDGCLSPIYLTTGIGNTPAILKKAKKVLVEINGYHDRCLANISDIVLLPTPPFRDNIPIINPLDKIGRGYALVDPSKVIGVVYNDEADGGRVFSEIDGKSLKIAEHIAEFLGNELREERIPEGFLPVQSGVGNTCNAVLAGLAAHEAIPPFTIYGEVVQDATIDLIDQGLVLGASGTSLSLTDAKMRYLYENFSGFEDKIVLRPQEVSNNPGIIRRLGVIAMNTAIEVDVYGHVNSTHFQGTHMMNGLGGSGDFERNAYLSIFMCPSTVKAGKVSTIVPMCTHVDHSEHSVQVVVTEQGLADLRGLSPKARSRKIIDNCAHPDYRDYLHRYLDKSPRGHIRHDLRRCFELHTRYLETGSMKSA